MLKVNKIYCGDCIEAMKQIPDKSVDAVVTDPPYELGFIGIEKEPEYCKIAEERLRLTPENLI